MLMPEICVRISDNDQPKLGLKPMILTRIAAGDPGSVWTAADFLDLGSRDAVDKVLQCLVKNGQLRRIDRGLYDTPRHNSLTQQSATHGRSGALGSTRDADRRGPKQPFAVERRPPLPLPGCRNLRQGCPYHL